MSYLPYITAIRQARSLENPDDEVGAFRWWTLQSRLHILAHHLRQLNPENQGLAALSLYWTNPDFEKNPTDSGEEWDRLTREQRQEWLALAEYAVGGSLDQVDDTHYGCLTWLKLAEVCHCRSLWEDSHRLSSLLRENLLWMKVEDYGLCLPPGHRRNGSGHLSPSQAVTLIRRGYPGTCPSNGTTIRLADQDDHRDSD